MTALLSNGYEVAEPIMPSPADLWVRDVDGNFFTAQVKSARKRDDRNGEIVAYTSNGKGDAYSKDDVDLFIAILDGEAYMFPNRQIKENWVTKNTIESRWTKLTTDFSTKKSEEVSA